jgi:AraC-like DNA-binding protein
MACSTAMVRRMPLGLAGSTVRAGLGSAELGLAARALKPLIAGLTALRHDWRLALRSAGIDQGIMTDPDARVPTSRVMALWNAAAAQAGDADLGLHIALAADVASFDIHAYVLLSSPTLGAGLERLCRYQRLLHVATRLELQSQGRRATLRHSLPGGRAVPRQPAEFLSACWIRFLRLASGRELVPLQVRFAHPAPADTREHEHLFRAPLRFAAGENALELAADVLELPCVRAEPGLLAVLDRHAEALLARAPAVSGLADRVRQALAEEMRLGSPRRASVAARLKTSLRTLDRRLAAEGTSLRGLLEQLRHELAARHLAERRLSVGEIAFLLGYSGLSPFHRAFKRWTGLTPAEYRQAPRAPEA